MGLIPGVIDKSNIISSDAGAADYFGVSCSLSSDGTVLAVGASYWDGAAGTDQGTCYIFDWNGSAWVERGKVLPSDAGANDGFGSSCSLSPDGTVLAVGAIYWDGPAGNDQGACYVFDWNGSAWVERGKVFPSDAGANNYFGSSCSLSPDVTVLAVGAFGWDGPAGTNQGACYVFDWNGSTWIERCNIVPSDAGANDYFGSSCSLSSDGTVLAVGAHYWDGAAGTDQGTCYVFDWNGSAWVERGNIVPSDAGAADYFGISCSLSPDGTVLAVGAFYWDGHAGADQGTCYLFNIESSMPPKAKVAGNTLIGTTPISTTVYVLTTNGEKRGETVSNADTGAFEIQVLYETQYSVVCKSPDSSFYNDLIYRVNAVPI